MPVMACEDECFIHNDFSNVLTEPLGLSPIHLPESLSFLVYSST